MAYFTQRERKATYEEFRQAKVTKKKRKLEGIEIKNNEKTEGEIT